MPNALSSSKSLEVQSSEKLSDISSDELVAKQWVNISDGDSLLVNACIDYDESVQVNRRGILQGATVQTVNINIAHNKWFDVLLCLSIQLWIKYAWTMRYE